MRFKQPQWAPTLSHAPDVSIVDFIFDEKYGRRAFEDSRQLFICGVSGEAQSATSVRDQVEHLAAAIGRELGWDVHGNNALAKVACIFSVNTIDYLPVVWAIRRLGGVAAPANAQYSATDLAYQLRDSKAGAIFTCAKLLDTALRAAKEAGIPRHLVYLMDYPEKLDTGAIIPEFKSTSKLVQEGVQLPRLEPLKWTKGQGKSQVAFLCYSSGTSGLPKGVMISHHNVITAILQISLFEKKLRDDRAKKLDQKFYTESVLGLLPFSHIYGLVVIAHASAWRGDSIVVLPQSELKSCLQTIQDYAINNLFLVPPIIVQMTKSPELMSRYDLKSVRSIFTGAAPLGQETAETLAKLYPSWVVRQAYGLTETTSVASSSVDFDIWFGSAGSYVTGVEARVVDPEGRDVTQYGQRGELWIKSPTLVMGYLNNEKANAETFVSDENGDRWMRTGDEVIVKKSPQGHDHLFVVDRIKDLIKVKGFQVAPAELEAHLLLSPFVADCAVVASMDNNGNEVPKAFVVQSASACSGLSNQSIRQSINRHVQEHKSNYKWLRGGIEFIPVLPKSPSGKILKRLLKGDAERRGEAKL
ncbi:uncharacterized protein BKA55DRAFT_629176 [Fusarium redolens]|uniref:Phenylacetyl-CoA ligase n=1 Tax=Fusarium redolens TaxID=48865 RepID=A0A9P9FVS5_FUSRE|nr:uncharacterized protein BKA55DRAFT_629176 [Fusarium redolens]KAH7205133.1 hypothetical protein BKA55DRAFT_629176 [Fusarium redolens]